MKVFISYRREDSAGHTGRLYDSLLAHFGKDGVFMDLSGIASGQNFVDVIHDTIRSSDVLIAVIGREWLTCEGAAGRRLDDPNDFVRTEIAAALERETPIIPVLVDGAEMPSATSLPDPLRPLATRDAHEISDERWSYDVGRLIDATRMLAGKPRWWKQRTAKVSVAALALAAILASAYLLRPRQASAPDLQDADGYLARGTALLTSADYDGAIAEFDRSLAIAPRSESYYHRGLAYYFKKDTGQAIADWTNAISLNARDTRAYRQRGNAYFDKGDYNLAVADYTRAIEIDPKDAVAYFNRGVLFRARGEPVKARTDFTAVLTLGVDPETERDARAQLNELGPPNGPPASAAAETATVSTTPPPRGRLAGDWSAEVTYDWGATHTERFALKVDGDEVLGTASYLGSPRGIVSGTLKGDRVLFQTRTQQVLGDWNKPMDVVHRYRGTISGDVIAFYLQSEGGSPSLPVEFTAKRVPSGR